MELQLIIYQSYDARKRSVDYTSFLLQGTEQLMFFRQYLLLMKQTSFTIKRFRFICVNFNVSIFKYNFFNV